MRCAKVTPLEFTNIKDSFRNKLNIRENTLKINKSDEES